MEKTKVESIADKIVEGVNSAFAEIDELRVQLALGKAEARDLYEVSKKKFHSSIHEMENKFRELKNKEAVVPVIKALELLRFQLELGKAETKELFEKQYTEISHALVQIELELKKNETMNETYARLHLELEKFKLKLGLFALHYKLTKITAQFNFERKRNEIAEELNKIKVQILSKKTEGLERWENFQDEIKEAYGHLKTAFKS